MKEFQVNFGMFDFDIIFLIGDYKEAVKRVEKSHEGTVDNFTDFAPRGRCFYREGYMPVVWVPKKPTTPRELATFSHECLHAVWHLFFWAGMKPDDGNEECMCHAMSHLITEALTKIRKT